MSKRKLDEISRSENTSNDTTDRALRLQRLQLDDVLNQCRKSLFRSLKVARGFERQKLGRRQKTAKAESNAADTIRLEAEVAALKNLYLPLTAEIHLYKSLLKIKSIASASAIPRYVQATIDASRKPQQVASVNVQARLFKSGPVQAALTEALRSIRAALGIEELKSNSKKRLRAKDYANDSQANDTNRPVSPEREGSSASRIHAQDEDERSGLSVPDRPEDGEDHGVQDDRDENVNYDLYASRLAASSDDESVEEDVEGQNHDRDKLDDMTITEEENEDSSEEDNTNSNVDDDDDETPPPTNPHPPRPIKTTKQPPTNSTTTKTTFLPSLSLSLAGYYSGSDSSPRSSSDDNENPTQARKNRMGQQARRALWEKKFGNNANHVKKGAKRDGDGDGGRDRKGALDGHGDGKGRGRGRERGGGRGRGRGSMGGTRGGRGKSMTGANSDPVGVRKAKGTGKKAEEGPLHPSWEAARRAKEQTKMAAPFQGKKVVF